MNTNAVLLKIAAPGTVDRSGRRTAEGAEVWSGHMPCYLRRAAKTVTINGDYTKIEFDQLVIQGRLPADVEIGSQVRGSLLTLEDRRDGSAERKFRAVGVEKLAAGLSVDSVRIELAEGD